jgi:hypothetical protein
MPAGTTMVDLAKNVHMPTRKSCLRCHAKAGGGDWTKRGDMGVNTAAPTDAQDVHMSPTRGNLSCADCHAVSGHKLGGRGIDLRATEAPDPKCTDCHGAQPHTGSTVGTKMNRHAAGQVACQTCHIKTFGKGGATEMSRDWGTPTWNQAFCNGQGGYVGHEVKLSNVTPEYRFFNGTSYVYNVGETITKNADGTVTLAKANGKIFDGSSKLVPIKNHTTTKIALLADGRIVPPAIMWMFMTGDFNQAVQKGMEDQGMTGSYTYVNGNAEMLLTHGVEPKTMAPSCATCHGTLKGHNNLMIPFTALGYHELPTLVKSCSMCHTKKSFSFERTHDKHRGPLNCNACHTKTPTGLIKPTTDLCNDCHEQRTGTYQAVHKSHLKLKKVCTDCHTMP